MPIHQLIGNMSLHFVVGRGFGLRDVARIGGAIGIYGRCEGESIAGGRPHGTGGAAVEMSELLGIRTVCVGSPELV